MTQVTKYNQILNDLFEQKYQNFWLVRKELKYLAKMLTSEERIHAAIKGWLNGRTVLLVLTSKRIIFINRGLLWGVTVSEIPLSAVNAVTFNAHLIFSEVTVTNGAEDTTLRWITKKLAQKFASDASRVTNEFQRNRLTQTQTTSPLDELKKAQELLNSKAISQREYDELKAKVLKKF